MKRILNIAAAIGAGFMVFSSCGTCKEELTVYEAAFTEYLAVSATTDSSCEDLERKFQRMETTYNDLCDDKKELVKSGFENYKQNYEVLRVLKEC